jgi:hypothetical protein
MQPQDLLLIRPGQAPHPVFISPKPNGIVVTKSVWKLSNLVPSQTCTCLSINATHELTNTNFEPEAVRAVSLHLPSGRLPGC